MTWNRVVGVLSACLLTGSLSGLAIAQNLPSAIEVCVEDDRCAAPGPFMPIDSSGAVSYATYSESGVDKVLLRYEVEGTIENTFGVRATFRDLVWIGVQTEYDINSFDEHAMTLFGVGSDAAIPNPLGLNYQHPIRFSTGGLLNGVGDTGLMGLLRNPPPGVPPTMFDYPIIMCGAVGCYAEASLNLVGMQFQQQDGVAIFAPQRFNAVSNDILLTRTTGFEGDSLGNGAFRETLTVRVSSAIVVPEPSSVLAGISVGVFGFLRRKRTLSC